MLDSLILFDRILMGCLCLCAFISFVWATRSHFVDTQELPLRMFLLFILTPTGTFGTLLTYYKQASFHGFPRLGLMLYAMSLVLFWWAIVTTHAKRELSIAFSSDLPCSLIETGPYRWVRHPFYASYLLFWLAGFVITGAWWLAVILIVMMCLYCQAAATEENKFARSALAKEYAAYTARTWMFIPGAL